jgi:hypothetical protein
MSSSLPTFAKGAKVGKDAVRDHRALDSHCDKITSMPTRLIALTENAKEAIRHPRKHGK